jgi:hypothetical protein
VSKHELIDDYISQRISRRMFIQGLTALGVSSGIAASYAVALKPAAAASMCDLYDFYSDFYELYCTDSGGNNPGGDNSGGAQPDGSQGGTGPTDVGQVEEGHKKKKRRKRKGNNKKKKH